MAYAKWLGAPHAQAADIMQDVLIGILRKFDDYEYPYTIARREVRRTYLRLLYSAREEPSDELEDKGQPLISDSHAFEELEQRFRYLPFLPLLPPKQQLVMTLTLDGASPSEIARDLGGDVTKDQVRANLTNARQKLQELMKQAEHEQEVGE